MYLATELDVNGRLLRGNVRMPDSGGSFPTIVFLHGFTVWKTGPQRLYEEFAREAVKEGFCVIRFDFYGTGESEGEFYEMTIGSEMKETGAIFAWARKQPYVDKDNIFLGGHSMGALVAVLTAPQLQPKGLFGWATAMTMFYQAGLRTRTMRGPTTRGWDIDGLELSREFMEEAAGMDFQAMAKGYGGPVLLIHGSCDTDIPVESAYILKKIYGDACQLDVVEGANHRFLSLPWKRHVYERTLTFLREQMGWPLTFEMSEAYCHEIFHSLRNGCTDAGDK